jgi:DNA invertase Pin-like site-specific DNA recombinase
MDAAYVRVSAKDQNEERQVQKMRELGVEERRIFIEKASGKDFDRPVYQAMKTSGALRAGDVLYIDSVDRLGRNYEGIKDEWKILTREMQIDVVALDMPDLFDSRKFRAMGEAGKLMEDQMLSLLAWVADQERKKIRQRQAEGIAIAKAEGKYTGRKKVEVDRYKFAELFTEVQRGERTNKYVMDTLGLKRNTYYKLVEEFKTKTGRFKE